MRSARFLVLLILALTAPTARAAILWNRSAVHVSAGYAFPEENKRRGGFESGFGFLYPVGPRFQMSVEFSHWTETHLEFYHKMYPGTISISPISVCIRYELSANRFFIPYAFAGASYVIARLATGPFITIPEVRIEQKIESGLSVYFGLGARIALTSAISILCEAGYLPRTAPAETIVNDMNLGVTRDSFTANLKTVLLKFGLQLYL